MKSLNKIKQYVEELKKPFIAADREKEEIKTYIQKLRTQKEKLERSTNVKDIDQLIEINSKYQAATAMLERVESDKAKLKEANGKKVFNELHQLRSEYFADCKKEVEPIFSEVLKKANELDVLLKQFTSYGQEKNSEFQTIVRSTVSFVSESTKNDINTASFLSISQALDSSFRVYDPQFQLWKNNIEKNNRK